MHRPTVLNASRVRAQIFKLQRSCLMPFDIKGLDWKSGILTPSSVPFFNSASFNSLTEGEESCPSFFLSAKFLLIDW